jgi:hypothetical protein
MHDNTTKEKTRQGQQGKDNTTEGEKTHDKYNDNA